MIKNFSIFKNKEVKNDKQPTHSISANVGTTENPEYVSIGACWTKEGKGGKFLSCKLQDVYVDHTDRTKIKKGFSIEEDKPVKMAKTEDEEAREALSKEEVGF
jgi:uncharacterized protein (DUF736 family)